MSSDIQKSDAPTNPWPAVAGATFATMPVTMDGLMTNQAYGNIMGGSIIILVVSDLVRQVLLPPFLLFFFSTIGLGAKLKTLVQGGKMLAILSAVAAVLLIVQNSLGVGLALLAGGDPAFGMLAGSVSFAGGHGTAIAWGQVATDAGLKGAEEFAIACATFGLIAGGVIGGPIGGTRCIGT